MHLAANWQSSRKLAYEHKKGSGHKLELAIIKSKSEGLSNTTLDARGYSPRTNAAWGMKRRIRIKQAV